ncbi:MAG: hypothetical protein GYA59_14230 [Chloroflexi bacterium]|nr:hypothetical protein [Chloroflexota bacterium]
MSFNPSTLFEQPLLRTKISTPQIPPEFVHRPRLTKRIDRGVMGSLTLLSAPAGFGKTNLLIEWAEQTSLPVAWLNIDGEDNDPSRFFRYLIGALRTLEPGLGEEALDFLQATRGSGLEVMLTLLINEITALPKEIVLVLDDFQALEEVTILQGLGFLLKHLPYNLHLIVASRSEPPLELAVLRAKGRVIELGMEDLRFTAEEVALFFQQVMGLRLPPETVQALEERTEGWITGLQMAAISLRHHPDPAALLANLQGDIHYLVDFLAEEVLDRQPEDVRQFLLHSSILGVLTGPLCEAVVNPEAKPGYGMVMLNRLEHANLFIVALDEKHEWFRFHHLFADFLRHIQAEINPGEIPVLQKRAAMWFEQNGNLDEAIQYALSSGDVEWTANLIERNIEVMIKTGEIFSLTRWVDKLPAEIIHQRPRLGLAYAWGSIAAYRLDNARFWIDDVKRTLDQLERHPESAHAAGEVGIAEAFEDVGLWNIRGGLAVCQSTLAVLSGDAGQAAEFSRQATALLREENPFIQSLLALDNSLYFILSGNVPKAIAALRDTVRVARQANNLLVMVIATCQLADMQVLHGQLTQAWVTLQKAQYMAVGPDGKRLPLARLVDEGFGEILLERNSLEEARIYLERSIEATGPLWWLSSLDGLVSLARLHQAQGNIAGARAIIEEASRIALSTESSQWDDVAVSAVAVRLALQREDLTEAIHYWEKGAFPDFLKTIHLEDYPYHVYEYLVLTQTRLLIAIGRSQRNESYLRRSMELMEGLLPEAKRLQRLAPQIEIKTLQAAVHFALGDLPQAVNVFRGALALGEPEGYQRIYLEGGPPIAELLAYCKVERRESDDILPSSVFIARLLESFQSEAIPMQASIPTSAMRREPFTAKMEEDLPVFLSAREVEVLDLIAEGKSNQEISAQLYLALNTVKRHAYNIYTKLGVKNRTQAVSKARQLGLIR